MKKIGTLTVHNGYNYGASLQAYATVHYLRNQGFDAQLIDYRNELIESKNNVKPSFRRSIINFFINRRGRKLRKMRFDSFNAISFGTGELKLSKKDLPGLNEEYDCFVCGSDQIWNPDITGYDSSFFLDFSSKTNISYAPSLGHFGNYSDELISFIKCNVHNIKYLSTRELENCELLSDLAGKACVNVLDPVFLLSQQNWSEIANKSAVKFKGRYAIYYSLHEDDAFFEFAKKDSKAKGLELYRLDITALRAIKKKCKTFAQKGIGPIEFLQAFKNSSFVYTNSFHGTAFSIIFNRPFITALLSGKLAGKNSRIFTLLELSDLKDRIYEKGRAYSNTINWEEVEDKLSDNILFSQSFLTEAVNE